jgi:hypothetical protein
MSQFNPQIMQMMLAAQQGQQPPQVQPPLSSDMSATAMHTGGGRGRTMNDLIRSSSAKGSRAATAEDTDHIRSDPYSSYTNPSEQQADAGKPEFQLLGGGRSVASDNLNAANPFTNGLQGLTPGQLTQIPIGQEQRGPAGPPQEAASGSSEQRLDNYEKMLSQTDPAKAADLALKRQEMQMKQAQTEHKSDLERFNANVKAFHMASDKGSADEDAAKQQVAGDAAKAKANVSGFGVAPAAQENAAPGSVGNMGISGEEGLPSTPPPGPVSMGLPASKLMDRLHMHKNAETIASNTKFQHGKFYKAPNGRIHQMIGSSPDGSPLFSEAKA